VIPHSDGAGVIDAVGPGAETDRLGRRVWVFGAQSYRAGGTAAEYTCVPDALAVDLPDEVSDEVGACLGIPGITAHRAVHADGSVAGSVVLVNGLGAVGSLAAQLAVRAGARVIATVRRSAALVDLPMLPGVLGVVALDSPAPSATIRGMAGSPVDRVIEVDFAGNLDLDREVLAVGGVIAAYASSEARPVLDFWPMLFDNMVIRLMGSDDFPLAAKVAAAADLTAAAADGSLRVQHADPLPLESIAAAHDLVDAGARERVLLAV
jgi:NADPH2:quinone reductase